MKILLKVKRDTSLPKYSPLVIDFIRATHKQLGRIKYDLLFLYKYKEKMTVGTYLPLKVFLHHNKNFPNFNSDLSDVGQV